MSETADPPSEVPVKKTSCRISGQQQIDEFEALCALRGRRPHELVADMVLDTLRAYRKDPDVAPGVTALVKVRREYEREQAGTGLRLIQGGASE